MNHPDVDPDVQPTALHVARLSREVEIDPRHTLRLREELVRRHQELTAEHTQRAARKLWPRFPRLKRLTLVASPALAAALACSAILWALEIGGQRTPQRAEAARLTHALERSAPSVVNWQVSLRQIRSNTATSSSCAVPLGPGQHLYVRGESAYLESGGHWYMVTGAVASAQCPAEFQWAFATLPYRLLHHQFTILPGQTSSSERIQYSIPGRAGARVQITVQVDRASGLVARLDRRVLRGATTVERDIAVYRYTRSQDTPAGSSAA